MSWTIRPAVRVNTPLIIGLAGPSKSGKTYSAHRVARGLAGPSGRVVMLNAEGARGHQYADKFQYDACDIEPPYSYARYDDALSEIAKLKPACVIVDSISHAHDGPGGMIEEHDVEVERRAGNDYKKRERVTFAAWIKPKQAETTFIYRMLGMDCPIILCFRAKEKLKIVAGKDPVDLGYQPIASERIAFETIFSLMLPPRSKGIPDLEQSDLREPFDSMIVPGIPLDETLGQKLAKWASGALKADAGRVAHGEEPASIPGHSSQAGEASSGVTITVDQAIALEDYCAEQGVNVGKLKKKLGVTRLQEVRASQYERARAWVDEVVAARKRAGAGLA